MSLIKWFEELSRQDVPLAGGKGANLGEMTRAGLPVPPGFVVTVEAYRRFYEQSGIDTVVSERLQRLDVDDSAQLRDVSDALQGLIKRARVPDEVRQAIVDAYKELSRRQGVAQEFVAARSSATLEDTVQFSFAGMFQSFLNVRGDDDLVRQIKACWASLFGARVLFYRVKQGLLGEQFIAVIVQKMVNADRSGVLFTVNPATNNPKVLLIEAAWGLGELVVGGQVTPDRYEVDKESLALISQEIGRKDFMLVRDEATGENVRIDLSADKASAQVLTEQEIRLLSELGKRDEEHYRSPQDAEWAIERGKIYLVQTRPVTTLIEKARRLPEAAKAEVLLHGLGASPGSASGIVRVLSSPEEADKLKPGDILVTTMTAPDWVPLMRRAVAIVTDAGGMTSHAAIVSRELGIPCIVGTRDATRVLKNDMTVTVNAREGTVVRGTMPEVKPPVAAVPQPAVPTPALVTATKLYVNLGEPELAEQ
ncbi:MAG: PEP-utilizing enzyme, partial [Chloroflexi bacterium]|nr:PEP-utilizing enzyme [Chloroflexota bacterium]